MDELQIHTDYLTAGVALGRDILSRNAEVLLRRGTVLTPSMIGLIREHGVRYAYVLENNVEAAKPAEEENETIRPLEDNPILLGNKFVSSKVEIPETRPVLSRRLRESAIESLRCLFSGAITGAQDAHAALKAIKQLDRVVDQIIDSITIDQAALVSIGDLKSYDEYTYHHSLSVAVLSVAVAQYGGYSREELVRVAKTAMMHDIGKTFVPIGIISKAAKLDNREFSVVKTHSRFGSNYLLNSGVCDGEICDAVLHHHEKLDGTGYPGGLKGEEIPFWSRIISVADVYDALTSSRPYRRPMQPSEALEYIMGGVGSAFDFDVVDAFAKKLEPYPVGSLVELSNGETAVVRHTQYALRPVVQLLRTGEILDLFSDKQCLNLVINRGL